MEVIIIGILRPVIEVAKCIGGPIKRHLNYLCCLGNNIQSLKDEAQKLKDKNDELQRRVAHAKNNAQVINPEVETWLENASQSKDIINGIENDVPNVQKRCLNLISRYSLSRKAKKTAEALGELHNYKFDQISQKAPPASVRSPPIGPNEEFETRRRIEEDVMEALRDRNVNMIGLCGMGGVGKTTMAERIMNRVKEEKLFDEALTVVVGQQVKKHQLQQEIAEQLGLTLDDKTLIARANKIHTRLTSYMKRVLVVVDDIWESLELQDLGIPSGNTFEKCKILLTSRDKSVLDIMETPRIFEIKILPEREAWILFRKKTGNCVDREDLRSVAEHVAKECKGLPVALVTVGGALKNKECRGLWDDALVQLRSSNPVHLPRVPAHVYNPLKLSYDYLEDKDARSLFLLCSMFEEDANIDLEMLTWCGMELNMFEGLRDLTEARNRTCALIEVLKDRSLLLGSDDEDYVKMHDVIRDMAIDTASREKPSGYVIDFDRPSRENCDEDCFWISMANLNSRTEFPVEFKCPSLRILMMQRGREQSYGEELTLPDNFFVGMPEIRVLFMEKICIKSLLPTQMLKNLKTLHLRDCQTLKSIRVVGELLKLEILSCNSCFNIVELPIEIGRLHHLKVLRIWNCPNLRRIVRGIISNLISLEKLSMQHSFNGWEAKESTDTKGNAALVELEPLTKLTCLKIEIKDASLDAEEIRLPSKIVKYDIEIPGPMIVVNWIKTLLRSTEVLHLRGNVARKDIFFDGMRERRMLSTPPHLKTMRLLDCPILKSISVVGELLKLEILSCNNCYNIEELPIEIRRLNHLRVLRIWNCPKLNRIVRGVISNLISLEELSIRRSFNGWEAKESTNTNASLVELEPLTKLTCLEIEIEDASLVAEEICLPSKIKVYDIKIGHVYDIKMGHVYDIKMGHIYGTFVGLWSERKMFLGIPGPMNVGNWVKTLLLSVEGLHLKGDGANQDNFFDGMQEIRKLSMEAIKSPPPIQMLKNLKELCLFYSPYLKSISVVGELLKLEILRCKSCESIEELPIEIGGLKHLKELSIWNCQNLKRIVCGVISNLISLEKLSITRSFNGWEAKRSTNTNATLVELEPLTELTLLEIEIKDVSLVAEEIRLPSKIKVYDIKIGDTEGQFYVHVGGEVSLKIPGQMNVGNWIKTIPPSTKVLHLKGDGANQVNLVELEKLKYLTLESCSSVKALVNTTNFFPLLKSLELISLDNLEEIIPTGMNSHNVRMAFPNLENLDLRDLPRLLIVQETLHKDNFFDGMPEIKVLSMRGICIKSLLPIQMLKNLKELSLFDCRDLESISAVGELLKLEILSCDGCHYIEELPIEIGGLKHLQRLRIQDCRNLKRIVRGVISNLISLEELSIKDSFNGWEAKESTNTKENVALVELEALTKLTCLEIEIKDVNLVAEEICLPSKIVRYDIKIMDAKGPFGHGYSWRKMSLEILGPMNVGNWIKTLLSRTEALHLKGDGANQVNWMELKKLNDLFLESCSSVKALVNATSVFPSLRSLKLVSLDNLEEIIPTGMNSHNVCMAFPNLQSLVLKDLPKLLIVQETLDKIVDPSKLFELWLEKLQDDALGSVWFLFSSFSNLSRVKIGGFNSIKNIMPLSIARNLVHLRRLSVDSCKMMLEVIADDDEEKKVQAMSQIPLFPHLEDLELWSLPKLRSFYQWNHYNTALELPSLWTVSIKNCPQMKTFTQGSVSTPRLVKISINDKSFDLAKGVNEAIQLYREGEQDEITSSSADP